MTSVIYNINTMLQQPRLVKQYCAQNTLESVITQIDLQTILDSSQQIMTTTATKQHQYISVATKNVQWII